MQYKGYRLTTLEKKIIETFGALTAPGPKRPNQLKEP